MYAAECNAVERGISFPQLMENAGTACAELIKKHFCISEDNPQKVLIICGKGKNGGDGFVIARKMREYGCAVKIILACGEPKDEISQNMFALAKDMDIDILTYENDPAPLEIHIKETDIVVDAVFGTGFTGALNEPLSELANAVNSSEAQTVAIDVPSGANCDAATVDGAVFKADITIAISACKPIHVIKPFNEFCGKTVIADIGMIESDFTKLDSVTCFTLDAKDIKKTLPERKSVSNKGTYGKALLVCGSMKMTGAATLAAGGALRTGAGLVTLAFPQSAYPAIAPKLTEPLLLPLESNSEGTVAFSALSEITDAAKKATAVLIGCGLGFNNDTEKLVHGAIKEIKSPMIIDADGINALSTNIDILKEAQAPVILTPHPGEMSRLCGKSIPEILAAPAAVAYKFAQEYGVTVVLKGANTVVCNPDNAVYINTTGNAGLARGGSGDLLAGMTTSLVAQGMKPFDAAVCAVYLHGLAADEVAAKTSMRGMLPSDVLNELPVLFSKFEQQVIF